MTVITISRQFGAGAWTLGNRLSKRLGYRYVDEDMIKEVASKIGASPGQVLAFEKTGGSKLMKFLDRIVSKDFIDRLISDKYAYVDEKGYVDVVKGIIQDLYWQGNVIIIGRGSQFILKDHEGAFHILLVQSLEPRIHFVMEEYKLGRHEAEKVIRIRDQSRKQFLSFFTEKEFHDDPINYDLVLNMNRMTKEKAEHLVVELIS